MIDRLREMLGRLRPGGSDDAESRGSENRSEDRIEGTGAAIVDEVYNGAYESVRELERVEERAREIDDEVR